MASAPDLLVVLNLAERALNQIRVEPGELGAEPLRYMVGALREDVSELKELATATALPKSHPARDLAVNSVLAAIGRLFPPHMEIDPAPTIVPRVKDLGASLKMLRTALSDPTTPPNE